MTRRFRYLMPMALAAILPACVTTTQQTTLDRQRLGGKPPAVTLDCPARLHDVVDARAEGEQAGTFGKHALKVDDATDTIRQQLLQAGLQPADSDAGRSVTVNLKKLYTTRNLSSNTPVVVYEVSIDQQPPFLVRPNVASVNWWGSEAEMYSEFNAALAQASTQLIVELNKRCD